MSQPDFFLSTNPKACLAYANFWYAQTQVQALVEQGQYPMPLSETVAQPRAQHSRFNKSPLVLLVKGEREQRGAPASDGFIQGLVVCHKKCVFVVD